MALMTMPRRLLLTFALAAVLLATSAVGSTEALPRKPRERSLAEGLPSGASKPGATSNHWIDSPVTFSAGGPPIYGLMPSGPKGRKGGVHAMSGGNSDASNAGVPWVVVLHKRRECSPARLCAEAQAEDAGRFSGNCFESYRRTINGMAVTMDVANLAAFVEAAKECVQEVWRDGTVTVQMSQRSPPWGLDRIDQRSLPLSSLYSYTTDGTGVHAYIIDTGIQENHNQFKYSDGRPGTRVRSTYSGFGDENSTDCHGHGTHVAATLGGLTFGVAKNVTLHAVRVLDCQGNAQYSRVIRALDDLAGTHESPAVAVLSLGGEPYNALDLAVQGLVDAGISVSVAAGNDNRDACMQSPARVSSVITVAATSSSDTIYWNSNFGECVDIFAPGVNILSAVHTSPTATGYMTGTSMAVPFVAGAAALFLERSPEALPFVVMNALVSSGTRGEVVDTKGAPNILLSTNIFSPVEFSPPEFRLSDDTPNTPFRVGVALAKRPTSRVVLLLDDLSPEQGTVTVSRLDFSPGEWNRPQYFEFEPSDANPRGQGFNLVFQLRSDDPEFDDLESYFQVTDDRQKLGEDTEYPLEVTSLPFVDTRSTTTFTHRFNEDCSEWGDSGNAPDVVYRYRPIADVVVEISLCDSDYDTKVFVLTGRRRKLFACNDDSCGYKSRIQLRLEAGEEYFIVVDGYDGDSGQYVIKINDVPGLDPRDLPPGEVDESVAAVPGRAPGESTSPPPTPTSVELSSLTFTNCELAPPFSPAVTSYACTTPPGSPETTVTYVAASGDAAVDVGIAKLEDAPADRLITQDDTRLQGVFAAVDSAVSATGFQRLRLEEGRNRVTLSVESSDGRSRTYEVVVTLRSEPREALLQSLVFAEGGPSGPPLSLFPEFRFDVPDYRAEVGERASALWIIASTLSTNPAITVSVAGSPLPFLAPGGARGLAVQLAPEQDTVSVLVVAGDGLTSTTYSLSLRRRPAGANPLPSRAAVDCAVGEWATWSECSVKCGGGGTQIRERSVMRQPANAGAPCPALVEKRACGDSECVVDCAVSPWGEWGQCSVQCGTGIQTRSRYVLEVPSGGGAPCSELTQQRTCRVPLEECFTDVDCQLGEWGAWSDCSANCGGGTQRRNRPVVSPALGDGAPCSVTEEIQPCNTQPCSAECQVTDWGRWGRCNASCGPGTQNRRRAITRLPSDPDGPGCPNLSEERVCNSPDCAPGQEPRPIVQTPHTDSGNYQTEPKTVEWSLDSIEDEQAAIPPGGAPPVARHRWVIYGFGPCSATCGGGVQDRIVQCAKIEADGWTLADPRACVVDGAGESPPAQRACNVAPCDQPVVTPGEWGACNAACGGGVQERPVMCRATAGALLPRSSCLQAHMDAPSSQVCAEEACPSTEPHLELGEWKPCSATCNGRSTREATCVSPDGLSAEGCDSTDVVLERTCGAPTCERAVWRVGPWSSCSSTCGVDGVMTRSVDCRMLGSDETVETAACETAALRPSDTAACGTELCGDCGADGDCSGSGTCDADTRTCVCMPGFMGPHCEVPPSCFSGVLDGDGACCPGAVDVEGSCCAPGASLDSSGACCTSGVLDACGVCDGPALSVDAGGACCAGPLDASGLCCPASGSSLDECGVCGGDGTSCVTDLDLVFGLPGVDNLEAMLAEPAASARLASELETFLADRLLPTRDGGPAPGRVTLQQMYSFRPGSTSGLDAPAGLSAQSAGPISVSPLGSPVGGGNDNSTVHLSRKKPRRRLAEVTASAVVLPSHTEPMVPVAAAWLDGPDGLPNFLSARLRLSGQRELDGTAVTAAAALAELRQEVATSPTDAVLRRLALLGVVYVERRGVCGNGLCEVGERPAGIATTLVGYELESCHVDCSQPLRQCPAPADAPDGAPCGGTGRCLHASGVCACFPGYTGDDCGQCERGFYRVGRGRCTPSSETLASVVMRTVSPAGGSTSSTVFAVSISLVIVVVCTAAIAGAFAYLRFYKRRAAERSAGEPEVKPANGASGLGEEENYLSGNQHMRLKDQDVVDPSIIECCLATDVRALERLSALHPPQPSPGRRSPLCEAVVTHEYHSASPRPQELRRQTGPQAHPTLDTTASSLAWESASESPRTAPPSMIMAASPAARPAAGSTAVMRESSGQETFSNMFWFPSSLGNRPHPRHELQYGPVATDSPTGSQRAAHFSPRRSAAGVNPRVLMERLGSPGGESSGCQSPV